MPPATGPGAGVGWGRGPGGRTAPCPFTIGPLKLAVRRRSLLGDAVEILVSAQEQVLADGSG